MRPLGVLFGCLIWQVVWSIHAGSSSSPQPSRGGSPLLVRVEDNHRGESLTVSEVGGRIEIVLGGSLSATNSMRSTISCTLSTTASRPPPTASALPRKPRPAAFPTHLRLSPAEVADAEVEEAAEPEGTPAAATVEGGSGASGDSLVDATLLGLDAAAAELLSARLSRARRGTARSMPHRASAAPADAAATSPLAASFVIDVPFPPAPAANSSNATTAHAASEIIELVATVRLAPASHSGSPTPSPTPLPPDGSVAVHLSTEIPSRIRRHLRGGSGSNGAGDDVLAPLELPPAVVHVVADVRQPQNEGASAVVTSAPTTSSDGSAIGSTITSPPAGTPATVFLEQRESTDSSAGGVVETATADVVDRGGTAVTSSVSPSPLPAEARPDAESSATLDVRSSGSGASASFRTTAAEVESLAPSGAATALRFLSRSLGSGSGPQAASSDGEQAGAGGARSFPATPRRFPLAIGSFTPDEQLEGLRASIALAVRRENEHLQQYREVLRRLAPDLLSGNADSSARARGSDRAPSSMTVSTERERPQPRTTHASLTSSVLAAAAEDTSLDAFLARLRTKLDRVAASYADTASVIGDGGESQPVRAEPSLSSAAFAIDLDDVCSTLQSCSACAATSVCTWCASPASATRTTYGGACVSSHSALEARTWLCARPFSGAPSQCPVPAAVRQLERLLRAEERVSREGIPAAPRSHLDHQQMVDAARAEAVSRDVWLRRMRALSHRDAAAASLAVRRALAAFASRYRIRRSSPASISPDKPLRVRDAAAVIAASTAATLDHNATGLGELRVTYRAVVREVERPATPHERVASGGRQTTRELRVLYLPVSVAPERLVGVEKGWWRGVGRLVPSPSTSPTLAPRPSAAESRSASPASSHSPEPATMTPSISPSPTILPSPSPTQTRSTSPSTSATPAPTPPRVGDTSIEGLLSTAEHASKTELANGGTGAGTSPKFADSGFPDLPLTRPATLLQDLPSNSGSASTTDRFAAAADSLRPAALPHDATLQPRRTGMRVADLDAAAADTEGILTRATAALEHPAYDFGPPRLLQVDEGEHGSGSSVLLELLSHGSLKGIGQERSDASGAANEAESTAQILRDEFAANAAALDSLAGDLGERRNVMRQKTPAAHFEGAPADLAFRAVLDSGSGRSSHGTAAENATSFTGEAGGESVATSTSESAAIAALEARVEARVLSPETLDAVKDATATVAAGALPAVTPSVAPRIAPDGSQNVTSAPSAHAAFLLHESATAASVKALSSASAQLSDAQNRAGELLDALKSSSVRARNARTDLLTAVGRVSDATMQLDADRAAIDLSLEIEHFPTLPTGTNLPPPPPLTSSPVSAPAIGMPGSTLRNAALVPTVPRHFIKLRHAQTNLLAGRIVAVGSAGKTLLAAYTAFTAARAAAVRDANATRMATVSIFRAAEMFTRARLVAIEGYRTSVRGVVEQARAVGVSTAAAAAAATQARQAAEVTLREADVVYQSAERRISANSGRGGQAGPNLQLPKKPSPEAAGVRAAEEALREAIAKEDATAARATAAARAVVVAVDAQEALRREQLRLEELADEAGSSATSPRADYDDPAVLEAGLNAARELALGARSNAPVGSARSKAQLASGIAAMDALAESASGARSLEDSSIARALDAARGAIRKTHATAAALSQRASAYTAQEVVHRVDSTSRALESVISLPEQLRIAAVGVQLLQRKATPSHEPSASGAASNVFLELVDAEAPPAMDRRRGAEAAASNAEIDKAGEHHDPPRANLLSLHARRIARPRRGHNSDSDAGDSEDEVDSADDDGRPSRRLRFRNEPRFATMHTLAMSSTGSQTQGGQLHENGIDPRYQLGPFDMPPPALSAPADLARGPSIAPQNQRMLTETQWQNNLPGPALLDQQMPLRQPSLGASSAYSSALRPLQSQALQGDFAYAVSLILQQQAQIAALQQQVSELQQSLPVSLPASLQALSFTRVLDAQQSAQMQMQQQQQQALEQQASEDDYRRLMRQQVLRQWQAQQQLLQPQLLAISPQWYSPSGGRGVSALLPRFVSSDGAAANTANGRKPAASGRASFFEERTERDDGAVEAEQEVGDAMRADDGDADKGEGRGKRGSAGRRAGGRRLLALNASEPVVAAPATEAFAPSGSGTATSSPGASPSPSPARVVPLASGPYVGPFSVGGAATPLPKVATSDASMQSSSRSPALPALPRGARDAAAVAARALAGTGVVFGPMTGFLKSSAPPEEVPVAGIPKRLYYELRIGAAQPPPPPPPPPASSPQTVQPQQTLPPPRRSRNGAESSPAAGEPLPSAPTLPKSSTVSVSSTASNTPSVLGAGIASTLSGAGAQAPPPQKSPQPPPTPHHAAAGLPPVDETVVRLRTTSGRVIEVRSEAPVDNPRGAEDDRFGVNRAVRKDGYVLPPIVDDIGEVRRRSSSFPVITACADDGPAELLASDKHYQRGHRNQQRRCRTAPPVVVAVEPPIIASSEEQLQLPRSHEPAASQPQGRRVTVTISAPDSAGAGHVEKCSGSRGCEAKEEGANATSVEQPKDLVTSTPSPPAAPEAAFVELETRGDSDVQAAEDFAAALAERIDRAIEAHQHRRKAHRFEGAASRKVQLHGDLLLDNPLYTMPEMPARLKSAMRFQSKYAPIARVKASEGSNDDVLDVGASLRQHLLVRGSVRSQRRQQMQRFEALQEELVTDSRVYRLNAGDISPMARSTALQGLTNAAVERRGAHAGRVLIPVTETDTAASAERGRSRLRGGRISGNPAD